MTSSSEQPPKESLVDEMMQEYSCIFYPMCFKARELLYCPKKIGKAECDDYRPHPAPARTAEHMQSAYAHGVMDGERKAREGVLKILKRNGYQGAESFLKNYWYSESLRSTKQQAGDQ